MVSDQDNPRDMPRLLEPGWVPAPSQARRLMVAIREVEVARWWLACR